MNKQSDWPSVSVLEYDIVCAAGNNKLALYRSLQQQRSGLQKNTFPGSDLDTWVGRVESIEDYRWHHTEKQWQSRNNALAAIAWDNQRIQQTISRLVTRLGAHRLGIVIGTSTASIDRTETAYSQLRNNQLAIDFQQPLVFNPHSPGLFIAHITGITGPCVTVNTACSSSAKVFASASRWLRMGWVDAVLVGGIDTLCLNVLQGFHALQLVSRHPCRPLDAQRDGINLGEAAGFAILTKRDGQTHKYGIEDSGLRLCGIGESSDAYHMSHPHPEGAGARIAIEQALSRAGLQTSDIDYINLHGTASRANDLIEGQLIAKLFPASTAVSSTKGWTGHTLGAAGITEAIIAMEAARGNFVPGSLNLQNLDENFASLNVTASNRRKPIHRVMSNSFGFGGNNACLIFSKER